MFSDLLFATSITLPIFCIIGCGIFFKRIGWIDDGFAKTGSDLVFKVTLPCLLFVELVETDFRHDLPYELVFYAIVATTLIFLFLDRVIAGRIEDSLDRGVFVQGSFRANMGIIGLAFCISAFGEGVVAVASIYLAVMTTVFNILSVITLTRHQPTLAETGTCLRIFSGIAKNPLILSIVAGVIISLWGFQVPDFFLTTGGYFARMTLPLALLCAGASLRLQEFSASRPLYWAFFGKLFLVPLMITAGGAFFGLRGESLGILYLMSSSPTAAASYPMTQAMGGNYHLAAAIIASTSLGAVIFTTLGLFLLRSFALI